VWKSLQRGKLLGEVGTNKGGSNKALCKEMAHIITGKGEKGTGMVGEEKE